MKHEGGHRQHHGGAGMVRSHTNGGATPGPCCICRHLLYRASHVLTCTQITRTSFSNADSNSEKLGWGLTWSISNKLSGGATAASTWTSRCDCRAGLLASLKARHGATVCCTALHDAILFLCTERNIRSLALQLVSFIAQDDHEL